VIVVDTGSGIVHEDRGKRLVGNREPRLDIQPVAAEIVTIIFEGKTDHRLKWYGPNKIRVLIGKILSEDVVTKQTVARRRKKFRFTIETGPAQQGWRKVVHGAEMRVAADSDTRYG